MAKTAEQRASDAAFRAQYGAAPLGPAAQRRIDRRIRSASMEGLNNQGARSGGSGSSRQSVNIRTAASTGQEGSGASRGEAMNAGARAMVNRGG